MKRYFYIFLLLALWGCSGGQSAADKPQVTEAAASYDASTVSTHQAPATDISHLDHHGASLPEIPDDVDTPSKKVDYLMLHMWDQVDFADTKVMADTLFVEQTFANFIELLPHSSSVQAAVDAIGRLYQKASVNQQAFSMMADMADKYLYTADSPMRNRSLYRFFLEAFKDSKLLTTDQREAFAQQFAELTQQQ